MSLPAKKLREAVFYAVFCFDSDLELDPESIVPLIMEQLEMSKKNVREAIYKASLIIEKLPAIDAKLKEHVEGYEFERISSAERNILRLATYEILFDNDLPKVVAIAEGIRLGRKFSTPEGANFINGVLDGVFKAQPICSS
jgi:N utilization substance protein B